MITRVLLGLLALVFYSRAEAADTSWVVYGEGNTSCGAWTKAQQQRPQLNATGSTLISRSSDFAGQLQWIEGYMSAFNMYERRLPSLAKGMDVNGLFAWIDNYCAAHPLDSISIAADALIAELSQRQR
jgi:hypothetical protein